MFFASNPPAASGYNRNGRGYPDISLIGTAYVTVIGGNSYLLYGTSASCPLLAGFVSLANAARSLQGLPPIGFLNPTLYSNTKPPKYNDVTSGNNKCCVYGASDYVNARCCNAGFTAQASKSNQYSNQRIVTIL